MLSKLRTAGTGLALVIAMASTALVLAPVEAEAASLQGRGPGWPETTPIGATLSQQEVDALLQALDDEYHAAAVYSQVIEDFGEIWPFSNILQAEVNHAEAVIRQMVKYGLEVPANEWLGTVASFDSLTDACAAAAEAEILNRDLYDDLMGATERSDLLRVFSRLQTASETRHLPAFEACAGVTS